MKKLKPVLIGSIIFSLVFGVSFVVSAGDDSDSVVLRLIGVIEKLVEKEDATPVAANSFGYNAQYSDVIVTKLVDMDDISTTGVDVTNEVTGDFYVDNIIIETNYATIASGTNFRIQTSGDNYGTSTILFDKKVVSMSKADSWDLNSPASANNTSDGTFANSASSTQRVLLEDGSKLIVLCTTAACKHTTNATTLASEEATGYVRFTTIMKRASEFSYTYE